METLGASEQDALLRVVETVAFERTNLQGSGQLLTAHLGKKKNTSTKAVRVIEWFSITRGNVDAIEP